MFRQWWMRQQKRVLSANYELAVAMQSVGTEIQITKMKGG